MTGKANLASLDKQARFNALNEQRKTMREEMMMKRRGLNFVTEHHEQLLEQSTIAACENQLDNVAPKIVGLLALGETCEVSEVR